MRQFKTLFSKSRISLDRSKRGPSSYKVFRTRQGQKLIQARGKDFEFLNNFKEEDSYIFTVEYSNKLVERKNFTNLVN